MCTGLFLGVFCLFGWILASLLSLTTVVKILCKFLSCQFSFFHLPFIFLSLSLLLLLLPLPRPHLFFGEKISEFKISKRLVQNKVKLPSSLEMVQKMLTDPGLGQQCS